MAEKPSTYNNPYAIHFCKAPSGLLVGWIEKDNGHFWGSGRTYSDLVTHVKNTLYQGKKCSTYGYFLDSAPVDQSDVPTQYMSKHFRTRAWFGGKEKEYQGNTSDAPVATKPAVTEIAYDYYDTAMDGDQLVIYGVLRKEIARYKTNPSNRTQDWLKTPGFLTPTAVTNNEDDDE